MRQSLGAGPCFGAATGTEIGEENKAPQGENICGGSQGSSRGDVPSYALNTGLEKGFSSAQGLWDALEEIHVSISRKALLTLDLPIKNLGGGG